MNRRSFLQHSLALAACASVPALAQERGARHELAGESSLPENPWFARTRECLGRLVLFLPEGGEHEAHALRKLGLECVLMRKPEPHGFDKPAVLLSRGEYSPQALHWWKEAPDQLNGCILVDPEHAHWEDDLLVLSDHSLEELEGAEVRLVDRGWAGLTRTDDPVQKAVRRYVLAHSGIAPLGLKGVPFVPSPNWDVRGAQTTIDAVVVHATVINTMEGTQRAFLDDRKRRVSAHYVVDRDGTIVQMVDERVAAWHAGVSELDGRPGVNDFSIGVELINLNDGHDPYPEPQYAALARIIRDLRTRHAIPDRRIVSHAEIARPAGRKSDPVGFDFDKLRRMVSS